MPSPPSRWTLRARLLASVLALFTLVMVATGAVTVLGTGSYLEGELVRDLQSAVGRATARGGMELAPGQSGRMGPVRGPSGAPGGGEQLVLVLASDGAVAGAPGMVTLIVFDDALPALFRATTLNEYVCPAVNPRLL